MLRLVRQRHENGCVPASIAILAGLSYSKALKLFWSKKDWLKRGTSYRMLLNGLIRAGLKVKPRKACSLSKLRSNAMLIIQHSHPAFGGAMHAVAWDYKNQIVLDPYPNKRRAIKRKFPLKSYEKSLIMIIEVR
jgi:hypothetical protein